MALTAVVTEGVPRGEVVLQTVRAVRADPVGIVPVVIVPVVIVPVADVAPAAPNNTLP